MEAPFVEKISGMAITKIFLIPRTRCKRSNDTHDKNKIHQE